MKNDDTNANFSASYTPAL